MAGHRKRKRTWGKRTTVLSILVIVLLSAVAVALSYLALTGPAAGSDEGFSVEEKSPQTEQVELPEPTDSLEPRDNAARLLTASGTTVLRGESGSCEEPGALQISFDGGQQWVPVGSPADAGATKILGQLTVDRSLIEVVALDEGCTPRIFSTSDRGESWTGPLPVDGTWYFDTSDPSRVGTPEGSRPLPCEGTQVAASGNTVAVLCEDDTLAVSGDRGLTFDTPEVDGVRAVAVGYPSFLIAWDGDDTCEGVHVGTLGQPDPGCYPLEDPVTPVTVARGDDSMFIWADATLAASTDGGVSWS